MKEANLTTFPYRGEGGPTASGDAVAAKSLVEEVVAGVERPKVSIVKNYHHLSHHFAALVVPPPPSWGGSYRQRASLSFIPYMCLLTGAWVFFCVKR